MILLEIKTVLDAQMLNWQQYYNQTHKSGELHNPVRHIQKNKVY